MFDFTITAKSSSLPARTGVFSTPHGDFATPTFMPCGTKAAVKTLTPDELTSLGVEILLGNTYHLTIRPGPETVSELGGLHRFMSWDRPILTDSGGYQVFSLAKSRTVTEDGALFRSPLNGSKIFLTPESAIAIQEELGADIIMAFDECPPGDAPFETVEAATERTHRWALRSLKAKTRGDQALFPIVQGGVFEDLRASSARFISELEAPGVAVGGVAVGESKEKILRVIDFTAPLLPEKKPRYLMGIGDPPDIVEAVCRGFDMFDCVLPTRLARHRAFWDFDGRHDLGNAAYSRDQNPLLKNCPCLACRKFTRAYLRHLMIEGEMLGHRLLSMHNLSFLIELVKSLRAAIGNGTLPSFRNDFIKQWYDHDKPPHRNRP